MTVSLAGATVTGRLTVTDPIPPTAQGQPAAEWDLFPDERRLLFVAPAGGTAETRRAPELAGAVTGDGWEAVGPEERLGTGTIAHGIIYCAMYW